MHSDLRDGQVVWSPATVEELYINSTDEEVITDAVIVYHAAFEYVADSASVQFLKDRTVRTKVISYVDASWLFSGEQHPLTENFAQPAMTPEGALKRTNASQSANKVKTNSVRRVDTVYEDRRNESSDYEGVHRSEQCSEPTAALSPARKKHKVFNGTISTNWRAADAQTLGMQTMHERLVLL